MKSQKIFFIHPNPDNILEIYFLIKGDENSSFKNGEYICKLVHHQQYPLKARDYYVLTPNGQFEINKKNLEKYGCWNYKKYKFLGIFITKIIKY